MKLFGTAGVRGVTNTEITPDLCLRLASSFGTWLMQNKKKRCKVCVANDTRYGAQTLAKACIAGVSSTGHDVIYYGIVPAGAFSLNITMFGADGGILITGSHMPPERIGLIVILEDGSYASFEITDQIEEIFNNYERAVSRAQPKDTGSISLGANPFEIYSTEILHRVDRDSISKKGFRILIDPANGAASVIAREIFEKLGCETININSTYQPVPDRPSEPRDHTVVEAKNIVKVLGLDLGICFDVDADRSLFIDQYGHATSEDTIGALFARYELQKDDVCVVPVNSSGLIEYVTTRLGARLEYCRIGHPETIKAIKELKAAFSYEESAKYYFARTFLWSDGIYTAMKLLEVMAKEKKALAELVDQLPKFYQEKRQMPVDEDKKEKIMECVCEIMKSLATENMSRDITIDGYKRIYKDNSWLLIRRSGTEPIIRIYSDATSQPRARELVSLGEDIVRQALIKTG